MQFDQLKRREFISLVGGAAIAWPFAAEAQQSSRMRRIGVIMNYVDSHPEAQARVKAFRARLHDAAWIEDRNVRIDFRWLGGTSSLQSNATELVKLAPDVILSSGTPATKAVQQATRTIPIVFANVADPVGTGLVASLSNPGSNITGFTNYEFAMAGKWLEILKEIAPTVAYVTVMQNPNNPSFSGFMGAIHSAAARLGIRFVMAGVRDAAEIKLAIDECARETNGALVVLPDGILIGHRDLIVSLAAQHHLPAIYSERVFTSIGGLVSYAYDAVAQFAQATSYIDRILKGAKPAELPVQAPTKFELSINLKTAKALGLTVPLALQARADEAIE